MVSQSSFLDLGLSETLSQTLSQLGFVAPTPVQAACIPALLQGQDVLGEAQTGTGKTGAFGLPLLERLDVTQPVVQALILTPTRELANQVAAALRDFARQSAQVNILSVYGGQSMQAQLRGLQAGAHIVVGTPGRVMDHLRRGTLKLATVRWVILDEADEMLRMGFVEDIEWILEQAPVDRQTALFSATMPAPIRRIAHRHLRTPKEIRIGAGNEAGTDIEQVYCWVEERHKLEALTRVLEVEDHLDAAMVFARTKVATQEIADHLTARGHSVAALNGDMEQRDRERVVASLRSGRLNVIIATDVAARGIDVPRISHVINYDAPQDAEAYVHRIGRTGRAGRKGRAILFVEPKKQRILRDIERLTRKAVTEYPVPDWQALSDSRQRRFAKRVHDVLAAPGLADPHHAVVEDLLAHCQISERDLARALVALATEDNPLWVPQDRVDPLRNRFVPSQSADEETRGRGKKYAGRERRYDNSSKAPRNDTRKAPHKPRANAAALADQRPERADKAKRDQPQRRDDAPKRVAEMPDSAAIAAKMERRPQSARPARPKKDQRALLVPRQGVKSKGSRGTQKPRVGGTLGIRRKS